MVHPVQLSRRTAVAALGSLLILPHAAMAQGNMPVVRIAGGRVRGRAGDGVVAFKGMRYGQSTAGPNRFHPPKAVEPWRDIVDAGEYGDQAPQSRSILVEPGPISEDCLRINLWTPAIDNRRRPVMLWFHGGGFEAGSGSSALYDGSRLARRGDVVVATINHRLNLFGHCFLGDRLGSDYASSGNVGTLDLLAAMRWVRENIAAFGGDPSNVTIFGQSGGGRKVSLCYATPAADGLFARGIVQSGSHLLVQTPEQASALTGLLLQELGMGSRAEGLRDAPMDVLIEAQRRAATKAGYRFEPMLDGRMLREQPWIPRAPAWSGRMPLMLGATRTELSAQLGAANPQLYDLSEKELPAAVARFVGADRAADAIRVFRASSPKASPAELFFTIASARAYGLDSTIMADARVKAGGKGQTFMYRLAWRSPAEGGRRISPHSLDLPFIFDNVATDAGGRLAGPPSAETAAMTTAMAESWLAFARTGDPNNGAIPKWDPYDLDRRATMIFDLPPRAENDPWQAERAYMEAFETQQGSAGRYRSAG